MKLNFSMSPWKKNAAIIAAAVTVVAGVVAGRERPALEIIQERAKPVAEDGIDLGKLRRGEANLPQNEPKMIKRWEEMRLYERIREARRGAPVYVLHDVGLGLVEHLDRLF